jgi:hypothetical protein
LGIFSVSLSDLPALREADAGGEALLSQKPEMEVFCLR